MGPSESAHSALPIFAPVSRAIASSTLGLTELSAKIVLTPSRLIVATRLATSPADGCAAVVRAGITAPITRMS